MFIKQKLYCYLSAFFMRISLSDQTYVNFASDKQISSAQLFLPVNLKGHYHSFSLGLNHIFNRKFFFPPSR